MVHVAVAAQTPLEEVVSLTTREEMEAYIIRESPGRAQEIIDTIACESDFNPEAVGDSGASFGLSQVHRPSHPQYSVETLTDPKWAIDFMIEAFDNKEERMWTCWRKLYGK
jgi:hypothetical protein